MRSKILKLFMLPLLALSLALGACENVGGPEGMTGPQVLAPSFEESEGEEGGEGFSVIRERDASVGVVTGVIGSAGGKLVLGKHELWVPANAVSGATTFSMAKLDGQLRFSLTATKLLTNDIGSSGFAVPVKLVINFKDASDEIEDPSRLRIFWMKLDGSSEQQQTEVDVVGKRAIGYLGHFSDYALVMP